MGAGGVLREGGSMDPATSALLTDLYQLNMMQAYLDRGETKTAVFEFFVRKLLRERGFLIAAGLEQVLEFLSELRFTPEELEWLASSGRFGKNLIDYLAGLRFTGAIHAMPEGTVFFPDEPILRVTAALPEAQLVETRLINLLQFQSMIAAKAARMVLAAPGKRLVDFGLRRAHGAEAGIMAARARTSASVGAGLRRLPPCMTTSISGSPCCASSSTDRTSAAMRPSGLKRRHTCLRPGQVALPAERLRRGKPAYSSSL